MSDWQAPTYDELGRIADSRNEIIKAKESEITRLRQLLSEAETREREARVKAVEDVLSALTAHELYQYRPKAFQGFIDYARSTLQSEER